MNNNDLFGKFLDYLIPTKDKDSADDNKPFFGGPNLSLAKNFIKASFFIPLQIAMRTGSYLAAAIMIVPMGVITRILDRLFRSRYSDAKTRENAPYTQQKRHFNTIDYTAINIFVTNYKNWLFPDPNWNTMPKVLLYIPNLLVLLAAAVAMAGVALIGLAVGLGCAVGAVIFSPFVMALGRISQFGQHMQKDSDEVAKQQIDKKKDFDPNIVDELLNHKMVGPSSENIAELTKIYISGENISLLPEENSHETPKPSTVDSGGVRAASTRSSQGKAKNSRPKRNLGSYQRR